MGETCSEKLKNNLRKAEGMLCGLVFKKLDILAEYKVNHKLLSEDGLFYIGICNHLLKNGYEVVDEVGFSSMVENFKFSESYEKKGGWSTIKAMRDIIDINNANTIIDNFEKWNLIRNYVDKGLLDLDKLYDKVSKNTIIKSGFYI